MNAAGRLQLMTHLQPFLERLWYTFRRPQTTGILFVVLVVMAAAALFLPDPPATVAAGVDVRTVWVNSLPGWLQPAGTFLFLLGFANLFRSVWFWLVVAMLLLNSLIALADYTPGAWRRVSGATAPAIKWQHPLARRIEQSVRLSNFSENYAEIFRNRLVQAGFSLYQRPSAEQQPLDQPRAIAAARHKWAWLGPVVFYVGVLLLVVGLLLTFFTLQTERLTLSPFQPRSTAWPAGSFQLSAVQPDSGLAQLTFTPQTSSGAAAAPQLLTWQRYRPALIQNTLILPLSLSPFLTVEVHDAAGNPVLLDPLPENVAPTRRLRVPLEDTVETPLYFTIPTVDVAVQIAPDPATTVYNVQVRQGTEAGLLDTMQVEAGQEFAIENVTTIIALDYNMHVLARRDAGWPFYVLAALLMVSGGILTLRRPAVVWLIPEIKGLGGQLYGVVESWGPATEARMSSFLETLLGKDVATSDEEGE